MRKAVYSLILVSVPLLMMLQVLQAFRYTVASEEIARIEILQEEKLEANRRLVAGIAVYDSPERVYGVATESLGLGSADPERILQVRLPEGEGE